MKTNSFLERWRQEHGITEETMRDKLAEIKKQKPPVCEFCKKPYKIGESFGSYRFYPDCDCIEENEKEQERIKQIESLYSYSKITPYFRKKRFITLKETPELKQCLEYAENFNPETSGGIQMIGDVGTGKTAAAAAICNYLICEKNIKCLFIPLSHLLDDFSRASYDNHGDITYELGNLCKYQLIVLDDIGRESYTDKRKETVFRIIDTLLNYNIPVIFTANPEMITKLKKIPELAAALDRLKEICKLKITFKGKSYRGVATIKN